MNERMPDSHAPFYPLRKPGEEAGQGHPAINTARKTRGSAPGPEKYIRCRQCGQAITTEDEKISVNGSHGHTFANPHGLVFDIGCFRTVFACGYAGPLSDEFTWFKGYGWRITVCGMCLTHLGWLFTSGGGDSFHGLILDRIVEASRD